MLKDAAEVKQITVIKEAVIKDGSHAHNITVPGANIEVSEVVVDKIEYINKLTAKGKGVNAIIGTASDEIMVSGRAKVSYNKAGSIEVKDDISSAVKMKKRRIKVIQQFLE